MKIEAGKFYRMRNGHKAYIGAVYNGGFAGANDGIAESMDKIIGWRHGPDDFVHGSTWYEDGSKYALPNEPFDLVSEWLEDGNPAADDAGKVEK